MTLTTSLYVFLWIMFLLGQLCHLFFIKMPSLKERNKNINKIFYFVDWWNCDWNIILGTQAFGIAIVIGLPELLNWKPFIWDYVRWFFFFVGVFNSLIFLAIFSKYSKSLSDMSDVKSNVTDHLLGGASKSVGEVLEKAMALGIDGTKPPEKK
jgi:hypothetical protein